MKTKIVILAAGQGTRMKSDIPKVMHKVCNLPMLEYVISNAEKLSKDKPIIVIGHKAEEIKMYFGSRGTFVLQEQRLGTGHALMMAIDYIEEDDNVLVICGDTPLIETDSLSLMVDKMSYSEGVIMTSVVENSFGYGRIMTDESGKFVKIVEEKDASEEEKSIKLINGGTYCIKGKILLDNLNKIKNNNNQNEYYLTEIFRFMNNVDFVQVNEEQLLGINSKIQLAQANRLMQIRINEKLMNDGVEIINPDVTYIDRDVKIGSGTIIYPNCHLRGYSIIGYNCEIMEDTTIENSVLRDNVIVKRSVIIDSKVGNSTTIGPYAYLRPNSLVGNNVKIGDFVEIKNASIGNGSKASHLSYIGDATIGKDVNIGCGVVFVNYDGKNKFKSIVNDNAFVGSNVNLVAPVEIGKSAYIATGTTVTVDIPDEALCIGRSRETIKSKWKKDK